MTKRKAKELLPTMKPKDDGEELTIPYEETEAKIEEVNDLQTDFGEKTVATLNDGEKKFNLFVNNNSLQKLIDAYGDDDENWKGQEVKLTLEKNEKFKNDMIVINPGQ